MNKTIKDIIKAISEISKTSSALFMCVIEIWFVSITYALFWAISGGKNLDNYTEKPLTDRLDKYL